MTLECKARRNDELDHSLIETKCAYFPSSKWLANQNVQCIIQRNKQIQQKNALKTNYTKHKHDHHGHYRQLIELKQIFVDAVIAMIRLAICSGQRTEAFVIQLIHIRIKCNYLP